MQLVVESQQLAIVTEALKCCLVNPAFLDSLPTVEETAGYLNDLSFLRGNT